MAQTLTRIDPIIGSGFGNSLQALFKLVLTGNYTTGVGGVTLDFTQSGANLFGTSQPPLAIWLDSGDTSGYQIVFTIGTTLANSKMIIYTSQGSELGSGAYSGALAAATGFIIGAQFTKY